MNDQRIIELVNGEIDGTLSPEDRNELTTLIEGDPSAKTLLDELGAVNQLLTSVPMVEPPASLKANIMRSIAHQESAVPAATESFLDRVLAPFIRRPAWAVAYAFGIGLIVGIATLSVIDAPGPDPQVVQGTIIDSTPTLGELEIVAGTATASIVVKAMRDELRVNVDLMAHDAATLRLVPAVGSPVVLQSMAGTPSYSVLLPQTSSIGVVLITDEVTEQGVINISATNND